MKIIIYTITDCAFSKQEKEYLTSHKLAYEEKNLETNREFLTEMLTISNNFAGTPVTKIEKEDGQIVVLKGFTSQEFDKALGFAEEKTPPQDQKQDPNGQTNVQTTPETADMPPVTVVPAQEPATPAAATTQPTAPAPQTTVPPAPQDPMSNVLNNLAQKAEPSIAPAPAAVPSQPAMPNIPDPKL
ncbi:MAG: glutaredoxin domain-containing protein [Patescibacteria group bacterium]